MKSYISIISSIVALLIAALIPLFVHSPFYHDLLITVIVYAILSMTFLMMLKTGLINLGIAGFWGFGSYVSVVLVMRLHMSFWISLPTSALITAIFALILGYPLLRSPGFTFAILTGVFGMLFTVGVGNISYLGGYNGIINIPPPNQIRIPFFSPIEFISQIQHYYLALFLFVVVILVCKAFYSSWIGRAWTAIGLQYQLAESLGMNAFKYKMMAFVLASAIDGLIGCFYAHYAGFIVPDTYGIFTTFYIHIYAVLGGIGHAILGPLVGSVLMTFFPELIRAAREVSPIFIGALLVLVIIFLPNGILSLIDRWNKKLFKGQPIR